MPGNDSNTLLLIHSDTINGSTTFTDSGAGAGCPHTITRQSVQHTTAQAKFGATSFGRVSGSNPYLKVNDTALNTIVSDDWCVDTWIYLQSTGYSAEILRFVSPQDTFVEIVGSPSNYQLDTSGFEKDGGMRSQDPKEQDGWTSLKYSSTQESVHFNIVMPAVSKPASRVFYGFRLEDCRNDDLDVEHSIVLACIKSMS